MGFEQLLGNKRLKENLKSSLGREHISHFYLISGPEGSGKHTLARLLAAAILCQDVNRPCGFCGPCRSRRFRRACCRAHCRAHCFGREGPV